MQQGALLGIWLSLQGQLAIHLSGEGALCHISQEQCGKKVFKALGGVGTELKQDQQWQP